MKHLLVGAAMAALVAVPAAAAESDRGGYVGIEGGVWVPNDLHYDIVASDGEGGLELNWDASRKIGYDIDLIGGYDWGMVRTELELGYKRAKHGHADPSVDFGHRPITPGGGGSGHTPV